MLIGTIRRYSEFLAGVSSPIWFGSEARTVMFSAPNPSKRQKAQNGNQRTVEVELHRARDRNRTDTSLSGPGILSPVRLPVSPPGHVDSQAFTVSPLQQPVRLWRHRQRLRRAFQRFAAPLCAWRAPSATNAFSIVSGVGWT